MTSNNQKYLTIPEQKELLKAVAHNKKYLCIVTLMMHCGLRVSEVINIRVGDIDFRNKVVSVKSLKKRGKEEIREIPLSTFLYDILVDYCTTRKFKAENYLFYNQNKQPITRQAVNKYLKEIENSNVALTGVGIHPHKLRHTFATMLRTQGAEAEDIKDALGHSQISTSLIYAHQEPIKLKELVSKSTTEIKTENIFQRIYRAIFKREKRIPNFAYINTERVLVGRKNEVKQVAENISKQVNTLILGEAGTGKSFLLESVLQSFDKKVLEFDDAKALKRTLTNTILYLLQGDKEQFQLIVFGDVLDDKQQRVKLTKDNVLNLAKILCQITEKNEYILSFENLDQISASSVQVLEILSNHFVVVGTARKVPVSKSTFVWNYEKIEIKNLDRKSSYNLIYKMTYKIDADMTHLKQSIFDASQGNPRMITQLIERISKEAKITREVITEITETYTGRELKQIDMSIYFLLAFGGLAVLRYLSAETGNASMRFIGGCFMIFMLFARYFFNAFKRQNV